MKPLKVGQFVDFEIPGCKGKIIGVSKPYDQNRGSASAPLLVRVVDVRLKGVKLSIPVAEQPKPS